MLKKIIKGRTDLVFEFIANGESPATKDSDGVSLMQWCAYFGDVSALRFLLAAGEQLESLGINNDLNGASFHGHWQLCQFLIENGADVLCPLPETAETPLHSAICRPNNPSLRQVVEVLVKNGANPNAKTISGMETGSFMRDCRTKGETPLHRAAAFASEDVIDILCEAGAKLDLADVNGDTALTWASWYGRPTKILRKLCFGSHRVHPERKSMTDVLLGQPIF